MLTVLVALVAIGALGLALGRAPLFRVLVSLLALLLYQLFAAAWLALLFGLLGFERTARGWGWSDPALVTVALGPPAALTVWLLLLLKRRGRPRLLWARANRPAALTGLDSRACPGRHWVYAPGTDGSASIRLQPNPFDERKAAVAFRMTGS